MSLPALFFQPQSTQNLFSQPLLFLPTHTYYSPHSLAPITTFLLLLLPPPPAGSSTSPAVPAPYRLLELSDEDLQALYDADGAADIDALFARLGLGALMVGFMGFCPTMEALSD